MSGSILGRVKVAAKKFRVTAVAAVAVVLLAVIVCQLMLVNVHTVSINDGGAVTRVTTMRTDKDSILELAGISVGDTDICTLDLSAGKIDIARAFPVIVNYGNEKREVKLASGTVADALSLANVTLDEYDIINLSLDTPLTGAETIDIINVDYEYATETEALAYDVTRSYSSALSAGEKTVTGGVEGEKQVTYCRKVVNGVVEEETVVSEVVTKSAVNLVETVGVKAAAAETAVKPDVAQSVTGGSNWVSTLTPSVPIDLDAAGKPVSYTRKIVGLASAYSPADCVGNCSTGVAPRPGYIAVNPRQIPYGTKMYIVSCDGRYTYGYAVAADTGGFVYNGSGRTVDLFFPDSTSARYFGVRNVEIYILG